MVKKQTPTVPKSTKKRRVSFQLPEPEDSSDDEPAVQVSVTRATPTRKKREDHDDEFETPEDTHDDSDSSEEEQDTSEDEKQDDSSIQDVTKEAVEGEHTLQDENGKQSDSEDDDAEESGSDDSSVDNESVELSEQNDEQHHAPSAVSTFGEMALDPRVERAIERLRWAKPTGVQSAVIPAALSARDLLVSAPTGSGKTGAYAVPIVQHLCRSERKQAGPRAVVLVPTRELVQQVAAVFKSLCRYIEGVCVEVLVRRKAKDKVVVSDRADVVVGTPAALKKATEGHAGRLSGVEFVVVDEADLVLSYGYGKDAEKVLDSIPVVAQAILVSATLEAEGMDTLKKVVLRRPVTVKVTKEEEDVDMLGVASHHVAKLKHHRDRYLVAYAMLRLNVLNGKVLIFMNHINSAFRLKLFLDQFKVKTAVLNSELPANSRMHCVQQFNAGIFDVLIATDESSGKEDGKSKGKQEKSKKRKRVEKDEEFGLSRGVDFRDVTTVFNFDVPESATSYTHRAGRTARAGKPGTVLTLLSSDEEEQKICNFGRSLGVHIGPLAFRMDQIEAFRYRVEDCLRMVTDNAVNNARIADIRREMVNSEQLQDYFEDNPQDLDALQHNLALAKNVPDHLAHIPSYLLPPELRETVSKDPRGSLYRNKRKRRPTGGKKLKNGGDPLKNFTNKSVAGSSRRRFQEKHGIVTKPKKSHGQLMRKRRRTY